MIEFKKNELEYVRRYMKGLRRTISTSMYLATRKTDKYNTIESKIERLTSALKTYKVYKQTRKERDYLKSLYKKYNGYKI